MKVSASLYSNKSMDLDSLVTELDAYQVDSFHIDCKDDLAVFEDIDKIRKLSNTAIDLHIISQEPEKFTAEIDKRKIEYVTYQFENLDSKFHIPNNNKTQFGLAITSDTPIHAFEPYEKDCSFILMMTTVPGESGGTFNKKNFKRIQEFRLKYPGTRIHVDGGVNNEVSFILRDLGVHKIVSGSYLVNHQRIGAAMLQLKHQQVASHYLVKDFMIEVQNLPVLDFSKADFKNSIQAIDKYNLGFVCYTDGNGKLAGISSNADIRKGIIQNLDDMANIPLDQIVNKSPVVIRESNTLAEMLELTASVNFPVLFLPVVDDQFKLVGAVTFNNLLRHIS